MNLSEKKHIIIFVLIVILAFLVGRNGIYKYSVSQINSVESQIEEEEKKNELLKMIGRLDEKWQTYKESSFLTPEITPFLDRVSQLAKEAEIEIAVFNPLPAIQRECHIELPVSMPLKCSYHQLGRFLSLLESNQEFIGVKELKMQKPTVIEPKEPIVPTIDLIVSGLYLRK